MVAYRPRPLPTNIEQLTTYLNEELERISDSITVSDMLELIELHATPVKLRSGIIVFADGTDWEPVTGQGQGFYGYYNGSWHKLG